MDACCAYLKIFSGQQKWTTLECRCSGKRLSPWNARAYSMSAENMFSVLHPKRVENITVLARLSLNAKCIAYDLANDTP